MPREGLQNSAQVINPGNPQDKRFALTRRSLVAPGWKNTRSAGLEVLKEREMRVPDEGRTYSRAKIRLRNWTSDNWTIEPHFRLVRTFDLALLQGAWLLVNGSQG